MIFSHLRARLNLRIAELRKKMHRTPLPVYTLTRICSVEYTKSVEPAFEIVAEPNRRAILTHCRRWMPGWLRSAGSGPLTWMRSNATLTTRINHHERKGRQGEDTRPKPRT